MAKHSFFLLLEKLISSNVINYVRKTENLSKAKYFSHPKTQIPTMSLTTCDSLLIVTLCPKKYLGSFYTLSSQALGRWMTYNKTRGTLGAILLVLENRDESLPCSCSVERSPVRKAKKDYSISIGKGTLMASPIGLTFQINPES